MELQHVQGLKSALERTTTERDNYRTQVNSLPEGVKIEDLPAQLEELSTLRSGRTSRETELQDSLTSRTADLQNAHGEVARLQARGTLAMAVAAAGGNGRFLVPALEGEIQAQKQDDGTYRVVVVGADGQPRQATDANGVVTPMTVDALVAEKKTDKDFGALFPAAKDGAGGNTEPVNGANGPLRSAPTWTSFEKASRRWGSSSP